MSKLVEGFIECPDLEAVRLAAELLGWTVQEHTRVMYFNGPGEHCDVTLAPTGELNRYGHDVGAKYTIGFKQTAEGIKVLHDNAMNGAEVLDKDKLDDTTERVVGKLKQAINRAVVERHLKGRRESWRVEQRGNVQVLVVRRG